MSSGSIVWLCIGIIFVTLLVLPRMMPNWLVPPGRVVGYVVSSWPGRVGLFVLWAYGGFHFFCQRP